MPVKRKTSLIARSLLEKHLTNTYPTENPFYLLQQYGNILAAFGPLRLSEICGLEDTDFNGNIAHIQRAVVLNENNDWAGKTTKSVAGNRFVSFPDFVIGQIRGRKRCVVHLSQPRFQTGL